MRRVTPILAAGLVFTASAAYAANLPRCITKRQGRCNDPQTLTALLDCQRRQQAGFTRAWQRAEGRQPPKRTMDMLQSSN